MNEKQISELPIIQDLKDADDTIYKNKIALDKTERKIDEDEYKKNKLDILKEIQNTKDLEIILYAEKFCVSQDIQKNLFSVQQGRSLKASLKEYNNGLKSVEAVEDKKSYRAAEKTYPLQKKEAGLPIDGFRQFARSQISRLDNSLKSPPSALDKDILEQRKANIETCVEIYKKKQLKALTVTQREKEADTIRNLDLKNINEKDFKNTDLKNALAYVKITNETIKSKIPDESMRKDVMTSVCETLANKYENGEKIPSPTQEKEKESKSQDLEM